MSSRNKAQPLSWWLWELWFHVSRWKGEKITTSLQPRQMRLTDAHWARWGGERRRRSLCLSWVPDTVICSNAGGGTAQRNVCLRSFQVCWRGTWEAGWKERPQRCQIHGSGVATVSRRRGKQMTFTGNALTVIKAVNYILNHICHSWHSPQCLPFLCRATRFNPICPLREVKVE